MFQVSGCKVLGFFLRKKEKKSCPSQTLLFLPSFLAAAAQAGGERPHPEDQEREDALAAAVHQRDGEALWQLHLLRLQPSGSLQRQHAAVP